jgi:hypothetical protein
MGKTLKVLNAVRQFEVGIPITHFQCAYFPLVDCLFFFTDNYKIQLSLTYASHFSTDFTESAPSRAQYIIFLVSLTRSRSQTLGICQDHEVKTSRQWRQSRCRDDGRRRGVKGYCGEIRETRGHLR